jgi:hypothetical protein
MKSFTIKSTILVVMAIFSISFSQFSNQVYISAPLSNPISSGQYLGLSTGCYILGVTNPSIPNYFYMLGLDANNNTVMRSSSSSNINIKCLCT